MKKFSHWIQYKGGLWPISSLQNAYSSINAAGITVKHKNFAEYCQSAKNGVWWAHRKLIRRFSLTAPPLLNNKHPGLNPTVAPSEDNSSWNVEKYKNDKKISRKQNCSKQEKGVEKHACYNITTLNKLSEKRSRKNKARPVDKLSVLVEILKEEGIDVCTLPEPRLKELGLNGEAKGDANILITEQGYTLYFSPATNINGDHGVAIVVRDACLTDIKVHRISGRLMWIGAKFNGIYKAIFCPYAPTETHSRVEKLKFYDEFNAEMLKVPAKYTVKICNGDYNARIGKYNCDWSEVRGRFITGFCNENGQLLLEFCLKNKLCIMNTFFQKRHYGTWHHHRSGKWFTLDYCLISERVKAAVTNCQVNTKIDCWSDHLAVEMSINKAKLSRILKIPKENKPKPKPRTCDYSILRSDNALCVNMGIALDLRIGKELSAEIRQDMSSDDCVQKLTLIFKEVTENYIPRKEHTVKNKCWFDVNDLKMIALMDIRNGYLKRYREHTGTKENKETLRVSLRQAQSHVTKACNKMYLSHCEAEADSMKNALDKSGAIGYYDVMNRVFGTKQMKQPKTGMLKTDGTFTNDESELVDCWIEHFKNLLNQVSHLNGEHPKYMPKQRSICVNGEPFNKEELLKGIIQMKNDKATGIDNTPVEFYAFVESDMMLDIILEVFNKLLRDGSCPNVWKDVIIAILFKKGAIHDCNNYRGLSLISHIGKVLECMIYNRLVTLAEKTLPEAQCGFRVNRSTADCIFVSKQLAASCTEKQRRLYKCFVDLTKAYDKVSRDILWDILLKLGVPENVVNLIKALHEGAEAFVRVDGKISDPFGLNNGLKQGSILSPILFNIFFGTIIHAFEKEVEGKGIMVRYKLDNHNIFDTSELKRKKGVKTISIADLLFADDSEILADSAINLQYMIDALVRITVAFGQEISIKKTEVLVTKTCSDPFDQVVPCEVAINGIILNNVKTFKYLGNTQGIEVKAKRVSKNRRKAGLLKTAVRETAHNDEISIRIQRMAITFQKRAEKIYENHRVPYRVKVKDYKVYVLTSALYACGTWLTTNHEIQRLEGFQYRAIRRMLGYTWQDYKSYTEILEQINNYSTEKIYPIEFEIRKRRLTYLGHVERMEDNRLPKIVLHGEVEGTRKVGRPIKTMRDVWKEDAIKFNIKDHDVLKLAMDRVFFRKVLDDGFLYAVSNWYADKKLKRARRLNPELHFVNGDNIPLIASRQNRFVSKRLRKVATFPEVHPAFFSQIEESRNAGHITVRNKYKKTETPVFESHVKRQLKALV